MTHSFTEVCYVFRPPPIVVYEYFYKYVCAVYPNNERTMQYSTRVPYIVSFFQPATKDDGNIAALQIFEAVCHTLRQSFSLVFQKNGVFCGPASDITVCKLLHEVVANTLRFSPIHDVCTVLLVESTSCWLLCATTSTSSPRDFWRIVCTIMLDKLSLHKWHHTC